MRPDKHVGEYLASAVSALTPRRTPSLAIALRIARRQQPREGIHLLPTETLTEIFMHALLDVDLKVKDIALPFYTLGDYDIWDRIDLALDIASVCCRWRGIIIDAPIFSSLVWRTIPPSTKSLELVHTFLTRSRHPASLFLTVSDVQDAFDAVDKLNLSCRRLGMLIFSGSTRTFASVLTRSLGEFPVLEGLFLDTPNDDTYDSEEAVKTCDLLFHPDMFSSTSFPFLQRLYINSHTHLSPQTRLPGTLKDLRLYCVRDPHGLVDALVHLPRLCVLTVNYLFSSEDAGPDVPTTDPQYALSIDEMPEPEGLTAVLGELEQCQILDSGVATLRTFLARLNIPSSAVVCFGCSVDCVRDREAWPHLASIATRHLTCEGEFAISSVVLQARSPMGIRGSTGVRAMSAPQHWTSEGHFDPLLLHSPRFVVHVRSRNHISYSEILSEMVRHIPSTSVTELAIHSMDLPPRNGAFIDLGYSAILSSFPNLDTLGVFGHVAPALYALSLPQSGLMNMHVLHSLSKLVLYDMSTHAYSRGSEMQELVLSMLGVRTRSGASCPRIVQCDCDIFRLPDSSQIFAVAEDSESVTESRMRELVGLLARRDLRPRVNLA